MELTTAIAIVALIVGPIAAGVIVWALRPFLGWLAAVALAAIITVPGLLATDPVLAPSVAAAAVLARRWVRQGIIPAERFRGFLPQLLMIGGAYGIYFLIRLVSEPGPAPAIANARDIIDFERTLHTFFEPRLHEALADSPFIELFNAYYLYGYWPFPIVGLFLFYLRDRTGYRILRASLGISAILALVTFALYPVAPPRLMPGLDIVDTIGDRTSSNQFAAVPSLHAGWPMLVGVLVFARARRVIRWLALIPGPLMVITIIATGNHYWLDAAIGFAYALTPAAVLLAADRLIARSETRHGAARI